MDGEANLPAPPPQSGSASANPIRPINPELNFSSSFTSSSSLSSPQRLVRDVQAAFKRHRPVGMVQSNNIKPRRTFVPQRVAPKSLASTMDQTEDPNKAQCESFRSEGNRAGDSVTQQPETVSIVKNNKVDAALTPPPKLGTITSTYEESSKPFTDQQDQPRLSCDNKDDAVVSSSVAPQHLSLIDNQKKVHFSLESNQQTQGAGDRMATGTDNILSHISSLALTEMEWDVSSRPEVVTSVSYDTKHQHPGNAEADKGLRYEGANSSSLAKRTAELQDRMHQFRNFLQGDLNQPMTQSSVVGSTCATTTLVNSASAPMLSSTTYCSHAHQNSYSNKADHLGEEHITSQAPVEGHVIQSCYPSSRCTGRMSVDKAEMAQASSTSVDIQMEVREYEPAKELPRCQPNVNDIREVPLIDDKMTKGKGNVAIASDPQHQAPLSKATSVDVKVEPSKLEKQEKVASSKPAPRKRSYDPDLFFRVNGKLYQRLGKIGSGGSSEVHKVISSDCHIYALKRIKLKGRDYATAYGFCQEIEYLNKLKGKSNIIQLIDYEVTDKTLLREVMNGSVINKDGRVKDDGYIYMVLEYGEIDLAHMLSHKWKEMDDVNSIIDENWLRFYWQQILLAVNTIHEERIVHSDLKPANFLLVRGSLKLIDFGIAKAIMSDTTNIQRDAQVGTLSYMSPEAFLCNETDANGNIIKCGRPSDIWSLGCILYQMVYGRTPFAEYKTFWAKFKVITDPNHEIVYEPVPNPWLVDLMKKCLAWERNERWRIPELLQHPFLVPPIPPPSLLHQDSSCKLLRLISESCSDNNQALSLCGQIQEILGDSRPVLSQVSISRDQQRNLLREMSRLCFQLQEQLVD